MLANLAVASLAALSAVGASPLQVRQVTSSAASVISGASSAVANATSAASSAATSATSAASSAVVPPVTTTANASAAATATSTGAVVSPSATGTTGNQTYPAYPCPAGYLLTYVTANVTLPVSLTRAKAAFGNWSTSPFFPNVTNGTRGSTVGATHIINIAAANLSIHEVLVNVTTNATTGFEQFTWNNTGAPISALGVTVSNYSTVLSLYDPAVAGGNRSNTTVALTYTNFCASSQPIGMQLVSTLAQLELGNLQAAVARGSANTTTTTTSSAAAASTAATTSVTSRVANATSSVASSATSVLANATSVIPSGVTGAVTAASSLISSAVLPASSSAA